MMPNRDKSSNLSGSLGESSTDRSMDSNNMSRETQRRIEMEKRAQDWEREEEPMYSAHHYDRHYRNDPDRNLQDLIRYDVNRKSRSPSPWEQDKKFNRDYRNEHGHSSLDNDERYNDNERDERTRYMEHHRPSSPWETKTETPSDPRLDPRRYLRKDSYDKYYNMRNEIIGQTSSDSRTSSWRDDLLDYPQPKGNLEQKISSTPNSPDSSSDLMDKDMRILPNVIRSSVSGKSNYDATRPSQPVGITRTVNFQDRIKSRTEPSTSHESQNNPSVTSQVSHSSQKSVGRVPPVPASHHYPPAQKFSKHSSQIGHQRPPSSSYRSDNFQPHASNFSPHMSPANVSSRESSVSPAPSGDVDMRIGAPKSVPLNLVSKGDISLIRKALSSLKTGEKLPVHSHKNKEQLTSQTKDYPTENLYDPEEKWNSSYGKSDYSKSDVDYRNIGKNLPHGMGHSSKINIPSRICSPSLPPQPPLPPPMSYSVPPPPPTLYPIPPPTPRHEADTIQPPSTARISSSPIPIPGSHPKESFNKTLVHQMQSNPTSSAQSHQHSNYHSKDKRDVAKEVKSIPLESVKQGVDMSLVKKALASLKSSSEKTLAQKKDFGSGVIKTNISFMMHAKPDKSEPSKSLPHTKVLESSSSKSHPNTKTHERQSINKDRMLEYLNKASLPPSKPPKMSSHSVPKPGSLGDLLLKAKNKGAPKDHLSESVDRSPVRNEETVSSCKIHIDKDVTEISPSEINCDNKALGNIDKVGNRKEPSNEPDLQENSKTSKDHHSDVFKIQPLALLKDSKSSVPSPVPHPRETFNKIPVTLIKSISTSSTPAQLPAKPSLPTYERDQSDITNESEIQKIFDKEPCSKIISSEKSKNSHYSSKGYSVIKKSLDKEVSGSEFDYKMKPSLNEDSDVERFLLQGSSRNTKFNPIQKSVGLSKYEKSRLYGHKISGSPSEVESKSKTPELLPDQDDLTLEPMQIDEDDDSNDSMICHPQEDSQAVERSSGFTSEFRDPRTMSQSNPRLDNRVSLHDSIPFNDHRKVLSLHKDPHKEKHYGNRDPRSQRTDDKVQYNVVPPSPRYNEKHNVVQPSPRYEEQQSAVPSSPRYETFVPPSPRYEDVVPPSPRYETGVPPSPRYEDIVPPSPRYENAAAHVPKFTPNLPPPGFDPTKPPPNYNLKPHSGPDLSIPPPMPGYVSNIALKPNPNIGMSQYDKGHYMKDQRSFTNPQVRQRYESTASRSNMPKQQFPVAGGVSINRSYFPQRADVPAPSPPQSPPIHSQVDVQGDSGYSFTCLIMKGLPFFANSKYIYYFFEEFLLLDIIIEVDYKYQCKGNAYIRFSSHPVAKDAIKSLNGWLMNGHQIILSPITIGFFNQAKNTYKAKNLEREASLGLPDIPRGNANPYFKQRPQKPPSPPPTQESAVSSSNDKSQICESPIKHHTEYKDPSEKVNRIFKVPKIKKKHESSGESQTKDKLKKKDLKESKNHISKKKSKKKDKSSKDYKKKYRKVMIESDSEEEGSGSSSMMEDGSVIDEEFEIKDKYRLEDKTSIKDRYRLEDKESESVVYEKKKKEKKDTQTESKLTKSDKNMKNIFTTDNKKKEEEFNYTDKKSNDSMKDKKKIKESSMKINSNSLSDTDEVIAKEIEDTTIECIEKRLTDPKEKRDTQTGSKSTKLDKKMKNISTTENKKKEEEHNYKYKKHIDSKKDRKKIKEFKKMIRDQLLDEDEVLEKEKDSSAVEYTDNRLVNPKKNKSKIKKKSKKLFSDYLSNADDVYENVKEAKEILKIDSSLDNDLDDLIVSKTIPEAEKYDKTVIEFTNEKEKHKALIKKSSITHSKVKRMKLNSLPSKKKSLIKKDESLLGKSKDSLSINKLDLTEVFAIVLAMDYIPSHKHSSSIPAEYLIEPEITQHSSETINTEISSDIRSNLASVLKNKKKVLKIKRKLERKLKKMKKKPESTNLMQTEKSAALQRSWRSQKLTITEAIKRKKVQVTIPVPQRTMIELHSTDKAIMIKPRMTQMIKQEVFDVDDTSMPGEIDSMEIVSKDIPAPKTKNLDLTDVFNNVIGKSEIAKTIKSEPVELTDVIENAEDNSKDIKKPKTKLLDLTDVFKNVIGNLSPVKIKVEENLSTSNEESAEVEKSKSLGESIVNSSFSSGGTNTKNKYVELDLERNLDAEIVIKKEIVDEKTNIAPKIKKRILPPLIRLDEFIERRNKKADVLGKNSQQDNIKEIKGESKKEELISPKIELVGNSAKETGKEILNKQDAGNYCLPIISMKSTCENENLTKDNLTITSRDTENPDEYTQQSKNKYSEISNLNEQSEKIVATIPKQIKDRLENLSRMENDEKLEGNEKTREANKGRISPITNIVNSKKETVKEDVISIKQTPSNDEKVKTTVEISKANSEKETIKDVMSINSTPSEDEKVKTTVEIPNALVQSNNSDIIAHQSSLSINSEEEFLNEGFSATKCQQHFRTEEVKESIEKSEEILQNKDILSHNSALDPILEERSSVEGLCATKDPVHNRIEEIKNIDEKPEVIEQSNDSKNYSYIMPHESPLVTNSEADSLGEEISSSKDKGYIRFEENINAIEKPEEIMQSNDSDTGENQLSSDIVENQLPLDIVEYQLPSDIQNHQESQSLDVENNQNPICTQSPVNNEDNSNSPNELQTNINDQEKASEDYVVSREKLLAYLNSAPLVKYEPSEKIETVENESDLLEKKKGRKRKSLTRKEKGVLEKPKDPVPVAKMDLNEVFDIVLAPDYIFPCKRISLIPDDHIKESKKSKKDKDYNKNQSSKKDEPVKSENTLLEKKNNRKRKCPCKAEKDEKLIAEDVTLSNVEVKSEQDYYSHFKLRRVTVQLGDRITEEVVNSWTKSKINHSVDLVEENKSTNEDDKLAHRLTNDNSNNDKEKASDVKEVFNIHSETVTPEAFRSLPQRRGRKIRTQSRNSAVISDISAKNVSPAITPKKTTRVTLQEKNNSELSQIEKLDNAIKEGDFEKFTCTALKSGLDGDVGVKFSSDSIQGEDITMVDQSSNTLNLDVIKSVEVLDKKGSDEKMICDHKTKEIVSAACEPSPKRRGRPSKPTPRNRTLNLDVIESAEVKENSPIEKDIFGSIKEIKESVEVVDKKDSIKKLICGPKTKEIVSATCDPSPKRRGRSSKSTPGNSTLNLSVIESSENVDKTISDEKKICEPKIQEIISNTCKPSPKSQVGFSQPIPGNNTLNLDVIERVEVVNTKDLDQQKMCDTKVLETVSEACEPSPKRRGRISKLSSKSNTSNLGLIKSGEVVEKKDLDEKKVCDPKTQDIISVTCEPSPKRRGRSSKPSPGNSTLNTVLIECVEVVNKKDSYDKNICESKRKEIASEVCEPLPKRRGRISKLPSGLDLIETVEVDKNYSYEKQICDPKIEEIISVESKSSPKRRGKSSKPTSGNSNLNLDVIESVEAVNKKESNEKSSSKPTSGMDNLNLDKIESVEAVNKKELDEKISSKPTSGIDNLNLDEIESVEAVNKNELDENISSKPTPGINNLNLDEIESAEAVNKNELDENISSKPTSGIDNLNLDEIESVAAVNKNELDDNLSSKPTSGIDNLNLDEIESVEAVIKNELDENISSKPTSGIDNLNLDERESVEAVNKKELDEKMYSKPTFGIDEIESVECNEKESIAKKIFNNIQEIVSATCEPAAKQRGRASKPTPGNSTFNSALIENVEVVEKRDSDEKKACDTKIEKIVSETCDPSPKRRGRSSKLTLENKSLNLDLVERVEDIDKKGLDEKRLCDPDNKRIVAEVCEPSPKRRGRSSKPIPGSSPLNLDLIDSDGVHNKEDSIMREVADPKVQKDISNACKPVPQRKGRAIKTPSKIIPVIGLTESVGVVDKMDSDRKTITETKNKEEFSESHKSLPQRRGRPSKTPTKTSTVNSDSIEIVKVDDKKDSDKKEVSDHKDIESISKSCKPVPNRRGRTSNVTSLTATPKRTTRTTGRVKANSKLDKTDNLDTDISNKKELDSDVFTSNSCASEEFLHINIKKEIDSERSTSESSETEGNEIATPNYRAQEPMDLSSDEEAVFGLPISVLQSIETKKQMSEQKYDKRKGSFLNEIKKEPKNK